MTTIAPDFRLLNINEMIEEVNQEYRDGGLSRKAYIAKFNRTKNLNSVSNQMKRFGSKVTREMDGYYTYIGKNFTIKFNAEYCESNTPTWEVNVYDENSDSSIQKRFAWESDDIENHFETKGCVVACLYRIDLELESN